MIIFDHGDERMNNQVILIQIVGVHVMLHSETFMLGSWDIINWSNEIEREMSKFSSDC